MNEEKINKFILLQYSGFQQTSEKCNICGHLIMEMVMNIILVISILSILIFVFYIYDL